MMPSEHDFYGIYTRLLVFKLSLILFLECLCKRAMFLSLISIYVQRILSLIIIRETRFKIVLLVFISFSVWFDLIYIVWQTTISLMLMIISFRWLLSGRNSIGISNATSHAKSDNLGIDYWFVMRPSKKRKGWRCDIERTLKYQRFDVKKLCLFLGKRSLIVLEK